MKYVREMEGLRGFMAMWVVLGHLATTVPIHNWFFRHKLFNQYAVDVFVLLSGFAIAAMINKRQEAYGLYLARRFLRIFPVYLLFLALSVAASSWALKVWQLAPAGAMRENRVEIASETLRNWWPHLIAHVTALHGLIPPKLLPRTDYAFLGQAWSISLEWQFYLIAPAFVAWLIKPAKPLLNLVIALGVCAALVIASVGMPQGFIGRWLHVFALGIATFYFMAARERGHAACKAISIPTAWAVIMALCVFSRSPDALPYVIWVSVVAAVIASREAGPSRAASRLSVMLCSRAAQYVGKMAYSVYLSHMLVIVLALYAMERLPAQGVYAHSALLAGVTILGTLVVSALSFYFVEKPFHEFGRRLRASGTAAPEAAAVRV